MNIVITICAIIAFFFLGWESGSLREIKKHIKMLEDFRNDLDRLDEMEKEVEYNVFEIGYIEGLEDETSFSSQKELEKRIKNKWNDYQYKGGE